MSKANSTAIQTLLESQNAKWTAAPTYLSELEDKLKSAMLGATPPKHHAAKKSANSEGIERLASTLEGTLENTIVAFPTKTDWRNRNGENYITNVKSQGFCSSCVSFSLCASLEANVRIWKKMPNYDIQLSVAHLAYCHEDANACTNGWWPTGGCDFLKKNGVAREHYYPYSPGNQVCMVTSGWESQKVQITGWTNISDVQQMKSWIANKGPIVACMEIFQDIYSYSTGVYHQVSEQSMGWHCMCIVGYDDEKQCWIAKNCWGPGWGEGGFINFGYGECNIETYGMFAFDGIVDTEWLMNKKINGLWANDSDANAWVFLEGEGWKQIFNGTQRAYRQLLTQIAHAKSKKVAVNVRVENGMVREVYS
jgi:C1A family cysteine protease